MTSRIEVYSCECHNMIQFFRTESATTPDELYGVCFVTGDTVLLLYQPAATAAYAVGGRAAAHGLMYQMSTETITHVSA